MSSKRVTVTALAALIVMAPGAVFATTTFQQYQEMRANTPRCDAHPEFPWIGRVSGNTEDDFFDRTFPVSLVGCFPTQAICEAWKRQASGLIDTTLIQYSCKPR